jgi:hypothetical protein
MQRFIPAKYGQIKLSPSTHRISEIVEDALVVLLVVILLNVDETVVVA